MKPADYDIEALIEIYDMDPETYTEVIESYLASWADNLARIEAAHRSGDCDQFRRRTHKLKGGSRTIGLMAIGDLCQELETYGREQDLAAATPLLARLAAAGADTCAWLTTIKDRRPA